MDWEHKMKPVLTIRPNEGGKSLVQRAKAKLEGESLVSLEKQISTINLNDKDQVIDILDLFFNLEFKK